MNAIRSKILAAVLRWIARILDMLLVFFGVSIAIGEVMPNPFRQPYPIQAGFFLNSLEADHPIDLRRDPLPAARGSATLRLPWRVENCAKEILTRGQKVP